MASRTTSALTTNPSFWMTFLKLYALRLVALTWWPQSTTPDLWQYRELQKNSCYRWRHYMVGKYGAMGPVNPAKDVRLPCQIHRSTIKFTFALTLSTSSAQPGTVHYRDVPTGRQRTPVITIHSHCPAQQPPKHVRRNRQANRSVPAKV